MTIDARHGPMVPARWRGYVAAVAMTALATVCGWLLYHGPHLPDESHRPFLANTNVLMLYLLGVLWVATRYSRGAATLASVLAVVVFDVCFVPPFLRLDVEDEQYVVTLVVMLVTALVINTLTHRVRDRAAAAREAWERVEAEFLRNTLLSGVSHDLRTPLATITGAASALTDRAVPLSPTARADLLATIRDEAERMDRLVNNLLDMTRLESGGLVLKREWQPLEEVIGSALTRAERRLGSRRVTTDVAPDVPLVCVDGAAITQVLENLIDNAVKYTPQDSPLEITARVDGDGADGGAVVVEVADRGPGLPAGTEGRVFQKFFRAGPSDAGDRRGIGLGLAICRGIIESHGGRITGSNRPGGGASFRFTLPRAGGPPPTTEVETPRAAVASVKGEG